MPVSSTSRRLGAVERHVHDPSITGSAIALTGATLAVAAVWLPLWEPDSLRAAYPPGFLESNPFANNLLIRGGWLFIGLAVACAVSVAVSHRMQRRTYGPIIAGIVAISLAALMGLTAQSLMPQTFAFSAGTAAVGLGVYAEMVAGLLMLIGGLQIRRSASVRGLVVLGTVGVALIAVAWWTGLGLETPAKYTDTVVEAPSG